MKIAYVIESFYNSGGMERNLSVKANWLVANTNYEITIITAKQEDKEKIFKLDDRVKFYDLGISNGFCAKKWQSELSRFLQKRKYDIIVSYGGMDVHFLPFVTNCAKTIVEFQFNYHIFNLWATSNKNTIINRLKGKIQRQRFINSIKRYDKFVVLTSADALLWSSHLPTKKVSYIHNPITIKTNSLSNCNSHNIVSVGRLDKLKGFDRLIDIWSEIVLKYPDWTLTIYGEGPERGTLEKKIAGHGLEQSVVLAGNVTDIPERLSEASIFVLTSQVEGFGLVLIEAMSCGLPVVAFDCPVGPSEIIDNEDTGFLVELNNNDSFKAKLVQLMSDDCLRKQMGSHSFEKSKQFDIDKIMGQWTCLYEQICNDKLS